MTEFIYFDTVTIADYDSVLSPRTVTVSDPVARWFRIFFPLGSHLYSRSHDLKTPWPLAKSFLPIPELQTTDTRFDLAIETAAHDFCQLVRTTGKTAYCSWSGGIDSTSILVSILKVADKSVLDNLIIECNENSIAENPYFYYKFIDGKLPTQTPEQVRVTPDNFDKILIADGDCAEMIMGSTYANKLAYLGKFAELDTPWRRIYDKDFRDRALISQHADQDLDSIHFTLDLISDTVPYAPMPVNTYYDWLCWQYFNFKIVDSMMRDVATHTKELDAQQSRYFLQNTLHRFYLHPHVQSWYMLTQTQRREKLHIDGKYFAKQYIHDFDGNDMYFYNKMKSTSRKENLHGNGRELTVAIDTEWNKYSLTNRDHRHMLGRLLNRI